MCIAHACIHTHTNINTHKHTQFYVASVRIFYYRSGLKLAVILASFLLTLLTALSRITDHKHHPTDVLSGLIIGTTVAAIVVSLASCRLC